MLKPLAILSLLAAPAVGQHAHGAMHGSDPAILSEPGQGAFAALPEIVATSEADPGTDGPRVDLGGLRAHPIDMDPLVTGSVVAAEGLPNGLRAVATGDAATIGALGRMVPAHAGQLAMDDASTAAGEATGKGAISTVTNDDPGVVARIHGLGPFGLMASRDHHREHRLAMATGGSPHGPRRPVPAGHAPSRYRR